MKNQPVISKTETLEDMVFEGRNKSYGAYELNRKRRKYLLIAFLFSIVGVSSAITVPFIRAINGERVPLNIDNKVTAILTSVEPNPVLPPPPPPPAPPPTIVKQLAYVPVIVEEAPEDVSIPSVSELADLPVNAPPPDIIEIQPDPTGDIFEPETETVLFPSEPSTFMNGGLDEFRKWVQNNIVYPQIAIENRIFGKVVLEFCINPTGKVVDIKVLRGVDPYLDGEAVRVISSSPLWTPPKQGGKPVKQKFVIPVTFRME